MLQKVNWPENRQYRSGDKHEPIEFYLNAIANSTKADLLLGYFSFATINLLSLGFAKFLHKGGVLRVVANNVLSLNDQEILNRANNNNFGASSELIDLTNIFDIKSKLSNYGEHFFNCVAWLIENNRIQLVLVKPKMGRGISHFKSGVFGDENDEICFKASCNFTPYGLLENLEEVELFLSWENSRSTKSIQSQKKYFEKIFSGKSDLVEYIDPQVVTNNIERYFGGNTLKELVEKEEKLIKKAQRLSGNDSFSRSIRFLEEELHTFSNTPLIPKNIHLRDYQLKARKNWLKNGKSGIFSMATGTGKTITALNCLVEEYREDGFYRIIILVPTDILVKQWHDDLRRMNFLQSYSSNDNGWKDRLALDLNLISHGSEINFALVLTYDSFTSEAIKDTLKYNDLSSLILVADEVHNLGTQKRLNSLPSTVAKKIGLSATPLRIYDSIGSEKIEEYFDSFYPSYTFSFPITSAIKHGFLTKYIYQPVVVNLNRREMTEYVKISRELIKHFDKNKNIYRESATHLLINRKRIIQKAESKKSALKKLLGSISGSHIIVYVPEGFDNNDVDKRIINEYSKIIHESGFTTHQILGETKNRTKVLSHFEKAEIQVLTAMKTLDEGVDIPSTKTAIFCSSTGNPKQFIQRRGRILRNHPNKKRAYIYDFIVMPLLINSFDSYDNYDKSLFRSELFRFVHFISAAENKYDLDDKSTETFRIYTSAKKMGINVDKMISEVDNQNRNEDA